MLRFPPIPRVLLMALATASLAAGAAELVTLSPDNYAEFAPTGKEARAIFGDYVLRNDRIVVAIADPTLLSGRSAGRWSIRNVSGAVIDLTLRDRPNDQLCAYYPAVTRYKPDAPNTQAELLDEALAAAQPGRAPVRGAQVSLTVEPYEMASGRMLSELAKLPYPARAAWVSQEIEPVSARRAARSRARASRASREPWRGRRASRAGP